LSIVEEKKEAIEESEKEHFLFTIGDRW
jgi:hypothetical protein